MAKIKAYKFTVRPTTPLTPNGGYDAAKKKFIKFKADAEVYEVLDAMAAACEDGFLDTETWVKQIFTSKASFLAFIENLEGWEDIFRITDQWWRAIAELVEYYDEEEFITVTDVANRLVEAAEETNQI